MARMGKYLAICIAILFAVSSTVLTRPVNAQTTPEFTLSYVDHSYYVPVKTISTIDPYTGKTITNQQDGYYIQNKYINLTIKNQQEPANLGLFYCIGVKGHFATEWSNYSTYQYNDGSHDYIRQMDGPITVLTFAFDKNNDTNSDPYDFNIGKFVDGAKIDFRVVAYTAYLTEVQNSVVAVPGWKPYSTVLNVVETSDLNNIQTILVPDGSVSTSVLSNTTPTTVPEFPVAALSIAVLTTVSLSLIIAKKKLPNECTN